MITFAYSDGSNETSNVSFIVDHISGFFAVSAISDTTLNQMGRALEDVASVMCGLPTELISIAKDETRDVTVT